MNIIIQIILVLLAGLVVVFTIFSFTNPIISEFRYGDKNYRNQPLMDVGNVSEIKSYESSAWFKSSSCLVLVDEENIIMEGRNCYNIAEGAKIYVQYSKQGEEKRYVRE